MHLFDSLKFAPLDEAWSPMGERISPRIENPYAPQEDIIDKATSPTVENRCQQYLEDVYNSQGVRGLIHVLQPEMVRDIQALSHPKKHPIRRQRDAFSLTFDEIILVCFGIFALILAIDS